MKCFYHKTDLDGICSAAIVKYKYPECEMIGVDYGDDFKPLINKTKTDEQIFIVDFSFPTEMMQSLYENVHLVWIDHHKTAIENCKDLDDIMGKREIGKGACELTWEYLFPDKKMPMAVKLLGKYDVWDKSDIKEWDEQILPLQYGFKLHFDNLKPNNNKIHVLWSSIFCDDYVAIRLAISNGDICLAYQKQQNQIACKNSFAIVFDNQRALCLNSNIYNSQVFDSIWNEEYYDIMLCFSYVKGSKMQWKVSLYTTKEDVDVSSIAKLYGGGGHKQAAGFYVDTKEMNLIMAGNY